MAEFKLVSEYPVRARLLFDLVRKPAFQEAMALRFGALEVTASEFARKGDILQMKIERTDPVRDFVGRLTSGKTERSVIIHDWNLDRLESHWTRHFLDRGRTVSAEGSVRVDVLGREACRLVEDGIITIKIPLLGRMLEQRVIDKLTEMQPMRVDFIMKQLGCKE